MTITLDNTGSVPGDKTTLELTEAQASDLAYAVKAANANRNVRHAQSVVDAARQQKAAPPSPATETASSLVAAGISNQLNTFAGNHMRALATPNVASVNAALRAGEGNANVLPVIQALGSGKVTKNADGSYTVVP